MVVDIAPIREFVIREYCSDDEAIEDDTPLITGGLIDSFSMVELVVFVEEQYGVEIPNVEVKPEALDSLSRIKQLIESKLKH